MTKKRILYISQMYPSIQYPQYAIFIHQQAMALISLGYEIDVIVPISIESSIKSGTKILISGVNVIYIKFIRIPRNFFPSIVARLFCKEILKYIDMNQYQIMHIHQIEIPLLMTVFKISMRYKIPYIVQYHGLNVYDEYINKKPLFIRSYIKIQKKILKKASTVICVSDKVQQIILKEQPCVKTSVVYNGVDTNIFFPCEYEIMNDDVIITCVANLIDTKGQIFLLKALKDVINKFSDKKIMLKIIGRGPNEDALRVLTKDLHLEEYVEFLGYLEYAKVADLIRQSQIFALPSYYEALGCVYLESMASKIVTIGCKGQGIDEIIQNGINGYLVEPQNSDSLANVIYDIIVNREKSKRVAYNGYMTVISDYTWKKSADSLSSIYDNSYL